MSPVAKISYAILLVLFASCFQGRNGATKVSDKNAPPPTTKVARIAATLKRHGSDQELKADPQTPQFAKPDDTVLIYVTFDNPVVVEGVPTLSLKTGPESAIAEYSSGSGSNILLFTYTVKPQDSANWLDNASSLALKVEPAVYDPLYPLASIKDLSGYNANLTLGAPRGENSIYANSRISFNTGPATISSVVAQSPQGTHKAGDTISIVVNFSRLVIVEGVPTLGLNIDPKGRKAIYAGGSNSKQLTFNYIVQPNDSASLLDYASTDALTLDGASISDSNQEPAILTLPKPGEPGSLASSTKVGIDGTQARITSVSSLPKTKLYKTGDTVIIDVTFNKKVLVTGGTPTFKLSLGPDGQNAVYMKGSGSTTLSFAYTIKSGDNTEKLSYPQKSAISIERGFIKDQAGNDANLELPSGEGSLVSNTDIGIDTIPAEVKSVTANTPNGAYNAGNQIQIEIHFSKPIVLIGTGPTLSLKTANRIATANYLKSTKTSCIFQYEVKPGDNSEHLNYDSPNALDLHGAKIQDMAGNDVDLKLPDEKNSLAANSQIIIDTQAPKVTEVTTTASSGSYRAGMSIPIQLTFSKPVTVTGGVPTLVLAANSDKVDATYVSGSGSNNLVFNYTIRKGDNARELDYIAKDPLRLNSATIKDTANNSADLTLPPPGGKGSLSASAKIVVDTVHPSIRNVTSATPDGAYKAGSKIGIHITFSKPVYVNEMNASLLKTDLPTLTLKTGETTKEAVYTSGSGSSILNFVYTVMPGDSNPELDYVASDALKIGSYSIKDEAGNDAILKLPAPGSADSLSYGSNIIIDTQTPMISKVKSEIKDGIYTSGAAIGIALHFTKAVSVNSGIPSLLLATGSEPRAAQYRFGSGTRVLHFEYLVEDGDYTSHLEYASTSALMLAQATIRDKAGNDANPRLPSPGTAESLGGQSQIAIDTHHPVITAVTSDSPDGTYTAGQNINIKVLFSKPVTVTAGVPSLSLSTGNTMRPAYYTSGSKTNTLNFVYEVKADDAANPLTYPPHWSLSLNGASIQDTIHNNAILLLPEPNTPTSLNQMKKIIIDTTPPEVIKVSSEMKDGYYREGNKLLFKIHFSKPVFLSHNSATLLLDLNGKHKKAIYTSGSGTDALDFSYEVEPGDNTERLEYVSSQAFALGGGTLRDGPGNDALIELPEPGEKGSISYVHRLIVDTTRAKPIDVTSILADSSFQAGTMIPIQVNFTKPVYVSANGSNQSDVPNLTLALESGKRKAYYRLGSGSKTLEFAYTVRAGDIAERLDYASINAIDLSGASIQDIAGNDADLELPSPGEEGSLGKSKHFIIDTFPPGVLKVWSSMPNGSYSIGKEITIHATFTETVYVQLGKPRITLSTGGFPKDAVYRSGSGSNTLAFVYKVESGDNSAHLDYVSQKALDRAWANIVDAAGNNADLTLPPPGQEGSLAKANHIVIDTEPARITRVSANLSDGTYRAGKTIPILVGFSKPVLVEGGKPTLALGTTPKESYAIYQSGSGTSTLNFAYTISEGENSNHLDYPATTSLNLGKAIIRDDAGNMANLALPVLGSSGSLSARRYLIVDTTKAKVVAVTSKVKEGRYKAGSEIPIQVIFSEPVIISGHPELMLNTGKNPAVAAYTSGSGTATIEFDYTVQDEEKADPLDYIARDALQLNGGAIKDIAGNDADLAMVAPGLSGSLAQNKKIVIDTQAPNIIDVAAESKDGAYRPGSEIFLKVRFSEPVMVSNGSPRLALATNSAEKRYANFVGDDRAANTLRFRYLVQPRDNSNALGYASGSALELTNAIIQDLAGNNADLALPDPGEKGSLKANSHLVIDSEAPKVLSVTSNSPGGTYKESKKLSIQVNFSEPVFVQGIPILNLASGANARKAIYASGSGSKTLNFDYLVMAEDYANQLEYTSSFALELKGGSIRDAAHNDADLMLPMPRSENSLSSSKQFIIDTMAPTVNAVSAKTANGTYKEGSVIELEVSFSEVVHVNGGKPTLALQLTQGEALATYASGSGSKVLRFIYTVKKGDQTEKLDYTSEKALALAGATITDDAKNDANLILPIPGAIGSLTQSRTIEIKSP